MKDNLFEMVNDSNEEVLNTPEHIQNINDIEKDEQNGVLLFETETVKSETNQETTIRGEDNVPEEDNERDPDISIVPVPEYSDVMSLDYDPETEEELIDITKALNTRMNLWQVGTYWMMGLKINSFYERKGNYGKGTLEKLSLEVGIGIDTLRKAIKFAKVYNEEQIKTLLNGNFTLQWNHIAQNLTVEPDSFVEVYKETNTSLEFHNRIIDCKKSVNSNVNVRGSGTDTNEVSDSDESSDSEIASEETRDEVAIDESGEHILNEHDTPVESEEPDRSYENNDIPETPSRNLSEEISILNGLLQRAKVELSEKGRLNEIQRSRIKKLEDTIADKDWIIKSVKAEADIIKARLDDVNISDTLRNAIDQMHMLLSEQV